MITFQEIKFKNFLSYGNYWTTLNFQESLSTCICGKNGQGKCFSSDTILKIRNSITGEVIEITAGELYEFYR